MQNASQETYSSPRFQYVCMKSSFVLHLWLRLYQHQLLIMFVGLVSNRQKVKKWCSIHFILSLMITAICFVLLLQWSRCLSVLMDLFFFLWIWVSSLLSHFMFSLIFIYDFEWKVNFNVAMFNSFSPSFCSLYYINL